MAFAGTRTRGSACGCCSCTLTGTFSSLSGTQNLGSNPMTATGAGEVLYSGAPAAAASPIKVTVVLRTDDDPASVEARLGREDASNYLRLFIAVDSGAVTVRPAMRLEGTDTWLADAVELDAADLSANTTVEICLTPGAATTPLDLVDGRLPTQADDEAGGWTNKTNVFLEDGNVAETAISVIGADDTDALIVWGWGFALPGGSVPTGILIGVQVEYESDDATVIDQSATFSTDTETSDQLATGTQVPDAGSDGAQPFGSDSDLSGTSPTYLQINDNDDFTFRVLWHNNAAGSLNLTVDSIICEVSYTTPSRLAATLAVKIGDQCVTFDNMPWFGDGTGVTLAFLVGDWEFSGFVLSYAESATRPTCPSCDCNEPVSPPGTCLSCASGFPPAAAYTVDFGAGGWTASPCDQCTDVSGIVTLRQGYGFGACNWIDYDTDSTNICFFDWDNTECGPLVMPFVDPDCSPTMGIMYRLILEPDGMGGFYWQLTVDMATLGGHPLRPAPAFARYTSASFTDEECQAGPWTLTKDIDRAGDSCGGALPATVDLEVA